MCKVCRTALARWLSLGCSFHCSPLALYILINQKSTTSEGKIGLIVPKTRSFPRDGAKMAGPLSSDQACPRLSPVTNVLTAPCLTSALTITLMTIPLENYKLLVTTVTLERRMADGTTSQKIKYALHLNNWDFDHGNKEALRAKGKRIIPADYDAAMKGAIFCTVCCTNLQRVPHKKEHFSNGRLAYFGHIPNRYDHVPCSLRSKKPEGKRYDTYEEARKALDAENLVVVSEFLSARPDLPTRTDDEYNATPVENEEGSLSETPISRHNGESFLLPSRVRTVRGICRNFDQNLSKYYVFPEKTFAARLIDLLYDIRDVTEPDDSPKLYYGRIKWSFAAGLGLDHNIRMTRLYCNETIQDFTLKTTVGLAREKGIDNDSKDRIVLVFGKVQVSGMGLSIEKIGWGSFDLLPKVHEHSLMP